IDSHQIPPEAKPREPARVEDTLICEVMDRDDGRCGRELRRRTTSAQQDGSKSCLPIVRVDDVKTFGPRGSPFKRSKREKCESLRVVRIVLTRGAVEMFAIEVRGLIDEHRSHAT